ncbi:SRPBCC family protein [Mycobacteroides abscessus]|uniref:SRPBCC family protein n=1 Tax=Mycobacteroides abscessus TaxID=36809 RepID=UPI0009A5F924|nr:SRPBCC family protein [Mycobacteroides abscessus]RIT49500.1 SRPBCC family protein [Mycobacteroides abscessus]SKU02573.1 cyclase/dehydrase [Mycobacteroides abscessus subsp. massiliense]SKU11824.1 cyclase/dehydrase [Mycobacteroides abscessus subsp. massiliense]
MLEVNFQAVCEAPVSVAWEYLSDWRNAVKYMDGMEKYVPTGPLEKGLGSTFEGVMRVGPTPLTSNVETVAWDENQLAVYKSTSGVDTITKYRFTEIDANRCEVEYRMVIQLPGGIAGRAMEKVIEPLVRTSAANTEKNMVRVIGEFYSQRKEAKELLPE